MRNSPVLQSQPSPAMTRLPPSPDGAAAFSSAILVPELTLDGPLSRSSLSGSTPQPNGASPAVATRLRSVAKYHSFRPQALACSEEILTTSYNDLESSLDFGGPSSLGAIAGPRGVALFRLSRPHIPLLIFSHATNASPGNKRNTISSLAFRPTATTANPRSSGSGGGGSSLYLAAARGAGVLIWDASGRSSNPLVGRLVVGDGAPDPSSPSSVITSMSWKPSSGQPLLATTTPSALSIWDIRSSQSSGGFQPSLRFGASGHPSQHHPYQQQPPFAPLVQVACSSHSDECATLDASGVVRVYDLRMTERGRSSLGSPLATFVAHEVGVGILHQEQWQPKDGRANGGFDDGNSNCKGGDHGRFRETAATSTSGSAWVTWGLESPSSSAVVKVWTDRSSVPSSFLVENLSNVSGDDDSALGGADGVGPATGPGEGTAPLRGNVAADLGSDYRLIARCSRPNLACARVCAAPVRNGLVVVGYLEGQTSADVHGNITADEQTGWWAELLTVTPPTTEEGQEGRPPESRQDFGLSRVARFHGGAANASPDAKSLSTVLGTATVGRLQAAELAFSVAQNSTPGLEDGTDGIERLSVDSVSNTAGVELLLCALTDTGVLTTHSIPEAVPKPPAAMGGATRARDTSPKRATLGNKGMRVTTQPAVYPESNEGNFLSDVAGAWGGNNVGAGTETKWANGNEIARLNNMHSSPQKALRVQTEEPLRTVNHLGDGGPMPFDMEADTQQSVPVAYGSVAAGSIGNIQISKTDVLTGIVTSNPRMDEVEVQTRDSSSIMENIETDRVPCPRLCGATFGSGKGGLVIFKNGEVKKMWDWYQRTDMIRLSSVPGGQVAPASSSSSDPDSLFSAAVASKAPAKATSEQSNKVPSTSGPRTLKELVDMITTAKEAQWGEGTDGSGGDDTMSVLEDFFEDESLDSNSDDSGDDDDDDEIVQPTDEIIYKPYFGGRPLKGTAEKYPPRAPTARSQAIISSILSPVVNVHHSFDGALLNGQSVLFATKWKLGPWDDSEASKGETKKDERIDIDFEDTKRQLPHYRDLVPATAMRRQSFSRTRSDPNLNSSRQVSSKFDLDQPVHGGEYSVRPNMEESMTFLRKLFSHHQEAGTTFPTLLSPPDSPVLMNQRVSSESRIGRSQPTSGRSLEKRTLDISKMKVVDLGVHTLRLRANDKTRPYLETLEETCRLCLRNAQVSKECGSSEKEEVWNMLAETVQNQMDDEGKLFNGWGGQCGGALGVELVANFFQFYEAIGDVQMLATMFCVLSGGRDRIKAEQQPSLIPNGNVYDNYIKRYAELLYSWDLLSVRAELNKHLTRNQSGREFRFLSTEGSSENGFARTLGVGLFCPRCNGDVDPSTNACPRCRDWAFRCSICDNAVRGLFTFCDYCHHGGHLQHLVKWFSSNDFCPTGCGCQCTFSPISRPS